MVFFPEGVYSKALQKQDSIKNLFDKITKASNFKVGDKVLKWDLRRKDKGKHHYKKKAHW